MRRPRLTIQSGVMLALLAQAVVAVFLLALTFLDQIAPDLRSPATPLPTGPVSPGDQTRLFRQDRPNTDFLRADPALPEQTQDFPSRLTPSLHPLDGVGQVLLLQGAITDGDADTLAAFLDGLAAPPDLVALNSPGGLVDEALALGRLIRERGLDTGVLSGAVCLSSCPYVLAGGVTRQVSRKGAVGLHQHYYDAPRYLPVLFAVQDIQEGQGRTMAFLIDMGVAPKVMLYSLQTPPEEIYVLVEDELLDTALATALLD